MKIYADESQNPSTFTGKSDNPNAFSDSKVNPTEKEKLRDLHGRKKLEYIWDYYNVPIIAVLVVVLVISYSIYNKLHQVHPVTSVTCTSIYFPDEMLEDLTTPFVSDYLGINPKKYEVTVDANLTLVDENNPENAEYAYTSQMKILAYISAGEMDMVFMPQNGFDYFSASGFLVDLGTLIQEQDPELYEVVKEDLVENIYIVSDNTDEITKDPTIPYEAVTDTRPFALDVSHLDRFRDFAGDQHLYLGIATNNKRTSTDMQYLRYLYGMELGDWVPELEIK